MTDPSRVVVLGSGFAGLWAALAAARRLDELGVAVGTVDVTMISSTPYHDIRVRDYESDLSTARIPLSALLDPVGIEHIIGEVTAIDAVARVVESTAGAHGYDRLVLAVGSRVVKPDIPACGSSASTSTPMTQRPDCKPTCAGLPRAPLTRRPRQ